MNNTTSPFVVFAAAGFVAGCCSSGVSAMIPPISFIIPSILFGVAVSYAVHTSLTPLSYEQRATIVFFSIQAYICALFAAVVFIPFLEIDIPFLRGVCFYAIAGGVGALVLAVYLVYVVQDLRSISTVIAVSSAGAVLGSLGQIVGDYISYYFDSASLGDFVLFPLWHAGVASVIPLFRRRPT